MKTNKVTRAMDYDKGYQYGIMGWYTYPYHNVSSRATQKGFKAGVKARVEALKGQIDSLPIPEVLLKELREVL